MTSSIPCCHAVHFFSFLSVVTFPLHFPLFPSDLHHEGLFKPKDKTRSRELLSKKEQPRRSEKHRTVTYANRQRQRQTNYSLIIFFFFISLFSLPPLSSLLSTIKPSHNPLSASVQKAGREDGSRSKRLGFYL